MKSENTFQPQFEEEKNENDLEERERDYLPASYLERIDKEK